MRSVIFITITSDSEISRDVGMQYMLGEEWQDLFDVVIVQARKPKFFTEQLRPFRMYDKVTKSQLWERVTSLDPG